MSMPAALDRYYTREEVLAFPDDGSRYELVHGELLVTPSPAVSHQLVIGRLFARLFDYVERHTVGRAFTSPADVSWGLKDVIVQPDIFVVAAREARAATWDAMRRFSLVVEVLSPASARHDRFTKRRLYQERGVPLYWLIDTVNRRVELWTPMATAPEYEEYRLSWHPEGAPEPFTLELGQLFAP